MAAATGVACGRATQYGLGGLVGYDFGPVNLKFYVTDTVYNRDALCRLEHLSQGLIPALDSSASNSTQADAAEGLKRRASLPSQRLPLGIEIFRWIRK